MSASVQVRRGGLYLSHEDCERYFSGLEAVILLRRADDLVVLPVRHAAAGGYLLKRINSRGDRLVFAPDFFREHGWDDDEECDLSLTWDSDQAGLVATDAFSAN